MRPTNRFRWVLRAIPTDVNEAGESVSISFDEKVLQQWWANPNHGMYEGKLNDDGSISEAKQIDDPGEWRDIQVENE